MWSQLRPLSEGGTRHPGILGVPTVCHSPLGELAVEDGELGPLAVHVIHPNLPCAWGERCTQLLSSDSRGRKKRGAMPVNDMTVARLSLQALSNPVETIFPLCSTENASLL